MSKLYLNPATKYVPQMDINVRSTENGGIEASQGFVIRAADVTGANSANLQAFYRGNTWESIFPEVPPFWRNLTVKEVSDAVDHAPGLMMIRVTFTGYALAANASSGDEPEVPTTSLRGNIEETSIQQMKKWTDLSEPDRHYIGKLITGEGSLSEDFATIYYPSVTDPNVTAEYAVAGGNAQTFARLIAEGKMTYKKGSWTYTYRTESRTGFSAAQLNTLGKIVSNPPGDPVTPSSGWTWLDVGPSQDQSGPNRFVKEISFLLIEDNADNQFFYGT